MGRLLVAAFVATFIAAIAAIVGVPVVAQETPAAPPIAGTGPGDEGAMHARLAALDTDHDGRISRTEWLAGGRKERGFDRMDANRDGYLTMDEIVAAREKMRAMRDAKGQ